MLVRVDPVWRWSFDWDLIRVAAVPEDSRRPHQSWHAIVLRIPRHVVPYRDSVLAVLRHDNAATVGWATALAVSERAAKINNVRKSGRGKDEVVVPALRGAVAGGCQQRF